MELNEIRALAEKIILRPGDLIIDTFTNSKGFLMFRRRHIDMIKDDMYLWQVNWFSHNRKLIYTNIDFYEEEILDKSVDGMHYGEMTNRRLADKLYSGYQI